MRIESIVAGYGGQGILLLGQLFAQSALEEGKSATWIPSYGAEMRGGTANCAVVVSDKKIGSPFANNPDILVAMNSKSLEKFAPKVRKNGIIILNSSLISNVENTDNIVMLKISATDIASELNDLRVANIVMLGALIAVSQVLGIESAKKSVTDFFSEKYSDSLQIVNTNCKALKRGYDEGIKLGDGINIKVFDDNL